jgi:nucleotide-binding universal stress UspA family protein
MVAYLGAHKTWLFDGNDYTMATVVPQLPSRPASMFDKATLDSYYHDEAETVLGPLRGLLTQHGLNAKLETLIGQPAEQIALAAQEGAYDLVIMGSHGHSGLSNLVLGSVSTKVLANCTVPVLVVR